MNQVAMRAAMPSVEILLALVGLLAVILGLRFTRLAASRGQRIGIWFGVAFGAVLAAALAIIKHNSASHAMIIFGDSLAGLLVALIGQGEDLRRAFKQRAAGDTNAVISEKSTRRILIVFCCFGAIALTVEYAIFWT